MKYGVLWLLTLLLACSGQGKPDRKPDQELSICFTGDVLLDRGVRKEIEKGGGNADFLFEKVAPLFRSSDAVVVNLECPVTDALSPINKRFIFRGDPVWLSSLRNHGIKYAVLANNHSIDQGRSGLVSTVRHLKEAGIQPLGYGNTRREASAPVLLRKGNTEVALYSSVLLPLENWVSLEDLPGVCQASVDSLCTSIRTLKETNPWCYVVVILHWGAEFQRSPVLLQRKQARMLVNAGADAIIGHHPHVVQEEEIYKGKPIFYSLGNFIFDQTKPFTDQGLVVRLSFREKGMLFEKYPVDIKRCIPNLHPDVGNKASF